MNAYSYNFGGKPQSNISAITISVVPSAVRSSSVSFSSTSTSTRSSSMGARRLRYYTVPTAAVLGGDFTGFPTIYDPNTTTIVGGVVQRTSFATEYGNGNKIPVSRIDPVAKAIQGYFPAPNAPGQVVNGVVTNNYVYTSPSSNPFTKIFWPTRLPGFNPATGSRLRRVREITPAKASARVSAPSVARATTLARTMLRFRMCGQSARVSPTKLDLGYTNQLNFFEPLTLGAGYPSKLGWQFAKSDNFPDIQITGYNQGCNSSTVLCSAIECCL